MSLQSRACLFGCMSRPDRGRGGAARQLDSSLGHIWLAAGALRCQRHPEAPAADREPLLLALKSAKRAC